MWTLLRLFPLLFGSYYQKGSQEWVVLTLMLDVVEVVFSPVQNSSSIAQMKMSIKDFLETYVELYGPNTMIPKFCYMVHYPYFTARLGPLVHLWTM